MEFKKESKFRTAVANEATRRGWKVSFAPDGPMERGTRGFPDLVLVNGERLLFRELKLDGRYARPEQREWLAALRNAGADAGIWKPADLEAGKIAAELGPVLSGEKLNAARRRNLRLSKSADIRFKGG